MLGVGDRQHDAIEGPSHKCVGVLAARARGPDHSGAAPLGLEPANVARAHVAAARGHDRHVLERLAHDDDDRQAHQQLRERHGEVDQRGRLDRLDELLGQGGPGRAPPGDHADGAGRGGAAHHHLRLLGRVARRGARVHPLRRRRVADGHHRGWGLGRERGGGGGTGGGGSGTGGGRRCLGLVCHGLFFSCGRVGGRSASKWVARLGAGWLQPGGRSPVVDAHGCRNNQAFWSLKKTGVCVRVVSRNRSGVARGRSRTLEGKREKKKAVWRSLFEERQRNGARGCAREESLVRATNFVGAACPTCDHATPTTAAAAARRR